MEIQNQGKAIVGIAGSIITAVVAIFISTSSPNVVPEDKQSAIHIIFVAGHGGTENNTYMTSGKQSPLWPDSTKIYEGVFNRKLVHYMCAMLIEANIEVTFINPYNIDMSLQERVSSINETYDRIKSKNPDMIVIAFSQHLNAQDARLGDYTDPYGLKGFTSVKTGGATGIETFTSQGWTDSDFFNENFLIPELEKAIPNFTWRYGRKQKGKEANFYVLNYTKCPIVLAELGFMTTYTDCQMLMDNAFIHRYLNGVVSSFKLYNNYHLSKLKNRAA